MNTNTLHTAPALSAAPARRRAAWQATLAGVALVAGLGAAGVHVDVPDVGLVIGKHARQPEQHAGPVRDGGKDGMKRGHWR